MAFLYKDEDGCLVINIEMILDWFKNIFPISKPVRIFYWVLLLVFWGLHYWLASEVLGRGVSWAITVYNFVLLIMDYYHEKFDGILSHSFGWWFHRIGIATLIFLNIAYFIEFVF